MPKLNEQTRAYIYRLAGALLLAAVVYGLIDNDDVDMWMQVVTAVLGLAPVALAVKNTSTDPNKPKTLEESTTVGDFVVSDRADGGRLFTLELDGDPNDMVVGKKNVTFRVLSRVLEDEI